MKTAFRSLAVVAVGVGLFGGVGCTVTAKSMTRFEGTPDSQDVAWAPGMSLTIDGVNGDIDVVQNNSDVVTVTFEPFVMLAHDAEDSEVRDEIAKLEKIYGGDANSITIGTKRNGGVSTLGANIIVAIPAGFDGPITIEQNNGGTDVQFAAQASALNLTSNNGSCDIDQTGNAQSIDVYCDNGGLEAIVSTVGSGGGSFRTGNGAIDLELPTGTFVAQASALDGGEVIVDGAEAAGCTVEGDVNKTVACNGGTTADPLYTIEASGTGLADVNLYLR